MTRYLLDTDALIDFSLAQEPASSLIFQWIESADILAVCAISVAEFYSGLSPVQELEWEPLVFNAEYWPITLTAAIRAGQFRYRLARTGWNMTTTDALLAAVALEQDATLVTGNVRHFPIDGLDLLPIR